MFERGVYDRVDDSSAQAIERACCKRLVDDRLNRDVFVVFEVRLCVLLVDGIKAVDQRVVYRILDAIEIERARVVVVRRAGKRRVDLISQRLDRIAVDAVNPAGAKIDIGAGRAVGPNPTANAVPRLQHDNLVALLDEVVRSYQPGDSGTDDDHLFLGRRGQHEACAQGGQGNLETCCHVSPSNPGDVALSHVPRNTNRGLRGVAAPSPECRLDSDPRYQ